MYIGFLASKALFVVGVSVPSCSSLREQDVDRALDAESSLSPSLRSSLIAVTDYDRMLVTCG